MSPELGSVDKKLLGASSIWQNDPEQVAPGQRVVWQPQPGPQEALISCPVFEVFYGGARGGGKTESSLGDWIEHSGRYGSDAAGLFIRRKLTQLEQVIRRSKALFLPLGARYNEQKKTWTMAGGATLTFAYLETDSDAENYQGHSYTRVYVEEATNFPSADPINRLRATLRSAAGVPTGMRLTGNPGGPGHNWVKARYIDPAPQGYVILTEKTTIEVDGVLQEVALERVFIPSKISDNQLLLKNDPTYILRLRQSGSEALVKAWLEGDWSIVDGSFFNEFLYEEHVLSRDWLDVIPRHSLRFRAFDWGSAKPFCCGWYVVSDETWGLPHGALLKYREWYGASGPNKGLKMSAELVAVGIRQREMGEHVTYGVADPSIFVRDGGPSIAETMAVQGVSWRRSDNRRGPGWEMLHQRLQGDPMTQPQRPMLYFLETCEDTIRTLPVLQHDETNIEDVDTDGEDHAGDETRYAVMSRPWVAKNKLALPPLRFPKHPSQLTINELIEKRTRERKKRERVFD